MKLVNDFGQAALTLKRAYPFIIYEMLNYSAIHSFITKLSIRQITIRHTNAYMYIKDKS